MLKHGLKFLWLSKITACFCQHSGGNQLVSGPSEKKIASQKKKRWGRAVVETGMLGWAELCYNLSQWSWPHPSLAGAWWPSVPLRATMPSFREKEALEMRCELGQLEIDGEGAEEGAGVLQHRRAVRDPQDWVQAGLLVLAGRRHLCLRHPALSVGTFHKCFL